MQSALTSLVELCVKKMMDIDSDSTFNGGSFGCIVSYATGSVKRDALTGFG